MRTSTLVLLIATQLVACNTGKARKYDPLRRAPVATETKSPDAKSPATTETNFEVPKEVTVAAIADRAWCGIRAQKTGSAYIVERYVFESGSTPSTKMNLLAFPFKQIPSAAAPKYLDRWVEMKSDQINTERGVIGVEPLTADSAQATAAFGEQGRAFNEIAEQNKIEVSEDTLGEDGAVRLTRPGQPEQILFACQNFSPVFVSLGQEPTAAPAAAAPAVTTSAAVEPAQRGTAAALRGPLVSAPVDAAQLSSTRWCTYKTIQNDVVVGLLQFGTDKNLRLSHLRTSMLKGQTLNKRGLLKANISSPTDAAVTGVKENLIVTSIGRSFRMIRDANDARALVLDGAQGNAAPTSTAEIFFECAYQNDPIQDVNVTKNLAAYMALFTK